MNRLTHVQQHLRDRPGKRARPWILGHELADLVEPLTTSQTCQEIADGLGPGWTLRLIDYRFRIICAELGIPPSRQHLQRVTLVRMVTGLDPCFCEPEAA